MQMAKVEVANFLIADWLLAKGQPLLSVNGLPDDLKVEGVLPRADSTTRFFVSSESLAEVEDDQELPTICPTYTRRSPVTLAEDLRRALEDRMPNRTFDPEFLTAIVEVAMGVLCPR